MTTETTIQELVDKEAIQELPQLYCHFVWSKDLISLIDLFTQDGEFDAGGVAPLAKGQEALIAVLQEGMTLDPRPYIHNHVIEMQSSDKAVGCCYLDLRLTRQGQRMIAAGHYDDVYKKVGAKWKFASRKFHFDFWAPINES